MRIIEVDAERLTSKTKVYNYMKELFKLPEYYTKNLNSLYDCLCEIEEDVNFEFSIDALRDICDDDYAFRFLMVIGKVVESNPHVKISFTNKV